MQDVDAWALYYYFAYRHTEYYFYAGNEDTA